MAVVTAGAVTAVAAVAPGRKSKFLFACCGLYAIMSKVLTVLARIRNLRMHLTEAMTRGAIMSKVLTVLAWIKDLRMRLTEASVEVL